eukprot:GHRQ01029455.1.p2 GENE.GHRQ01029455.1~~GHRQ01029455.1.p2  ORF type:complete len:138 (+),score=39.98 GHRQ01029455.1:153-566(+)
MPEAATGATKQLSSAAAVSTPYQLVLSICGVRCCRFTFDHVYDQDSSQQEVYNQSARPLVLSTLQGYNAAIIAYGQTGTGKTYTMEGELEGQLRGIIPRRWGRQKHNFERMMPAVSQTDEAGSSRNIPHRRGRQRPQ